MNFMDIGSLLLDHFIVAVGRRCPRSEYRSPGDEQPSILLSETAGRKSQQTVGVNVEVWCE